MPEQITRYPDVTLQVLKGAGAQCGVGAPQKILTQCPKERFCSLPSGELCIYGIEQIPQMTQIRSHELAQVLAPAPSGAMSDGLALAAAFLAGGATGWLWHKLRSARHQHPRR
ncbi:hypothetical protein D3870_00525 [Noviherbaspirillum cavernae]|uniref:Uncharacterized protein n=1 Tax=Noviherbaspirillum cavernae TaxID=2320862 RepID=A0A418WWT1_9BURK|nr:hypothetical protein [Noviherbaspirillum cavernae]RJG04706.1 hypothetical protein D3870_00525 [Noviherbaspirillum cavernae]